MRKRYLGLLLLLSCTAQAADWGRLFYSQDERERGGVVSAQNQNPAVAVQQPVSMEKRFDGELQTPRKRVRWVNGQIAEPRAGVKPGDAWVEH